MERVPVLLDTDIGSDIDDAVALAYLLRQPRCELLGITTVTGEVEKRAALCETVCRAAGRTDIPIQLGRRDPLLDGPGQPRVPHYDEGRDGLTGRPENTAVQFLREKIYARPGEITLLTIGPYTNVALLFALDPAIPQMLKAVVSMGGTFGRDERAEWNARVDPAATSIVYRAARRNHLSVGLNVTEQCRMTKDEVALRFVGEPLETVRDMAQAWFEHARYLTFHDPLAAALIFRPGLATYQQGRIESVNGLTHFTEGEGPDRIAVTIDSEGFFEEFFGTIGRK
ncbi:nucleoside hydrolase [bacterium]|nr:MAG: nucleoside hydrolase [bacterium]